MKRQNGGFNDPGRIDETSLSDCSGIFLRRATRPTQQPRFNIAKQKGTSYERPSLPSPCCPGPYLVTGPPN